MANSLTALNKEVWARKMQEILEKDLVALSIANTELRSLLNDGDVVHKPYRSKLRTEDYTKGTAITAQDVTATDESLSVDTTKVCMFYIDDIDKIQNSYDTMNQFAMDVQYDLNRAIDRIVLAEYANADWSIDDGDIGGTAGSSAVISASNVNRLFSAAGRKLTVANVKLSDRFAVISPSVLEQIQLYTAGKDTAFGDQVMNNGYVGERFGFKIYLSNNLTNTAVWTPANNPSNTQTITIAGVTFTFVSSIGSTAGNVLIGGSTAATLDNLVALINDQGTTSANQVALSAASREALEGISATDGTTYLGITFKGGGEVAYTTSDAADAWSAETVHCLFGKKGAIDLVIQKQPNIQVKDVADKLGVNVIAYTLFGVKTFDIGDAQLVDVKVDSSNF